MCVHAHACVSDVFAIHDNNISPRQIMIIIRIIILYFIHIRHTDDFSSTGTRLVINNRHYSKFIKTMEMRHFRIPYST